MVLRTSVREAQRHRRGHRKQVGDYFFRQITLIQTRLSRLYNERAYVLSRGFVRRALEIPLGGLESEISWMYYTNGRLKKVVHDAQVLIEKSKIPLDQAEADGDVAVPRLSGGGIITLDRTLAKLQGLLDLQPRRIE